MTLSRSYGNECTDWGEGEICSFGKNISGSSIMECSKPEKCKFKGTAIGRVDSLDIKFENKPLSHPQ